MEEYEGVVLRILWKSDFNTRHLSVSSSFYVGDIGAL